MKEVVEAVAIVLLSTIAKSVVEAVLESGQKVEDLKEDFLSTEYEAAKLGWEVWKHL